MTRTAHTFFKRSAASLLVSVIATQPVVHANVPLAQSPAGTGMRLPAPNVIISVDDSGSMGDAGIRTLQAALLDTFSSANLADGDIRLAWQSMNRCFGIPSNSSDCNNRNALRVFSGDHRRNFTQWVNTLSPGGGTPSHRVVRSAGDYLRQTGLGINSPWASEPGVREQPVLSCRKSYHLFMTDGSWNSSAPTTNLHIDGDRTTPGYRSNELNPPHGNIDGSSRLLGDGLTSYNPDSAQTRIYADRWGFGGNNGLNTLSDLSFYYWATDLQPGIPNNVAPTYRVGDETITYGNRSTTLARFWNPKNDPATWQHLVTYSVGFGSGASGWSGRPAWTGNTHQGDDYHRLILGLDAWPSPLCNGNTACDGAALYSNRANERQIELWHMALNGRGLFVPAPTADSLGPAFRTVLNEIITDRTAPITSLTATSASVARTSSNAYSAGYNAEMWSGYISAQSLAQGTGAASANTRWNRQSTADKLDALSNLDQRLILTSRDGVTPTGTSFRWANDERYLSNAQKALFFTWPEAQNEGQARLNYLRGDRSRESSGAPRFRTRASRQGDIVNSRLWYVAQPAANHSFDRYASFARTHQNRLPMLYVGGNDGMLHGFSAEDGQERIAYVPRGVLPNLRLLTNSNYNTNHRYFVDGSPFSGDVNWGTSAAPDWRTLLIGTLGAGGKGYFVLNVTQPGGKVGTPGAPATQFAETNAPFLVVTDQTLAAQEPVANASSAQAHLGHITVPPVLDDSNPFVSTQITRLNNGKWAAIMGNGYNSAAGRPALLIQYLDGSDQTLQHIPVTLPAARGDGNGLSAPRLVDLDGDGRTDVVYAGDLKGNLWKFNLLGPNSAQWNVAFNGSPLYTSAIRLNGGTEQVQPITAPPVVRANTRNARGLMVAFGTGRNLAEADRSSTATQTLYSVLDNTTYHYPVDSNGSKLPLREETAGTPLGTGFAQLVEQRVLSTHQADGRSFDVTSANTVNYQGTDPKKGWFMHLPVSGERLLDAMSFYDGSNILEVVTEIPATSAREGTESCEPHTQQARYLRTFINIMDGRAPSFALVDLNGDGWYGSADLNVSRLSLSGPPGLKINNACSRRDCRFKVNKRGADEFAQAPVQPIRPSWRHLQ